MRLLGTVPAGSMRSVAVHFQPGDVLYGRLRPYLNKVFRPEFEGLCSAEFIVLPPSPAIDGTYLQYMLNTATFVEFASHLNTGDRPRVDFDQIGEYVVPVPPLAEQCRIVGALEEHLSELDAAVAGLQRVQAQLPRYRASVLHAACDGSLIERKSSEDPGEQSLRLPAGWTLTTVGDLAVVGTGATPLRSNPRYFGGVVPWVTSGALNDAFVHQASEYVTECALEECNLTLYPPGTLLIAMYGEGRTRGKCSELMLEATTNQAIAAIRLRPEAVHLKSWVKLCLQSQYEEMRRVASGGVQPNLNLGLVRSIVIPVPPSGVWEKLVDEVDRRLSLADELDRAVSATLVRSAAVRTSLLDRAFSGALVSQYPADEPADQLVARIRTERAQAPTRGRRRKSARS